MLYFAYGSNLDWKQMKDRCPSAQFVCIAALQNHRLAFTRFSNTRNCGVADVIYELGKVVWGVVYQISEHDIGSLDRSEGFKPDRKRDDNAYVREERHVFAEGDEKRTMSVTIYIANKQKDPPLPNSDYKKLIVEGAKYWHLPEEYIRLLEQIQVAP